MQFKHTIVRRPPQSMSQGITSAKLGPPDYHLALKQHDNYINTLKKCRVQVTILEADEKYPDSCFVEDVALLTAKCAIITRPGAASRQGEEIGMKEILGKFYSEIEPIEEPGTIDGGDVMKVGDHFYIGLSARTNREGARQTTDILRRYGYTASVIPLSKMLHLKTGVAYLENNNLLVSGEFIDREELKHFNKIVVEESEGYAANCIWVNDKVLVPAGYEKTQQAITMAGYEVEVVDTSEFRKLDGGLSCLSLRF